MERVSLLPSDNLFNSFLNPKYIPSGKDKYYLRDTQVRAPKNGWRHLKSDEIETLVKNDNTAISWDTILVTDEFEPMMIKNNQFYGLVRIGRVSADGLQYHDLRLPCGITNSSIHSCDIGDDVAIHNVHYLSHYIVGDKCMLFNVQEISCTDHAKFGNGILKEGEQESVRTYIQVMNETGSRSILPFDGMIAADAYMWAKYIDDTLLQERLHTITQNSFDNRRGFYGTIGSGCVIKNSWIIKDVKIGSCCYIKGASKLKNLTINSSEKEPTQIGENVVLVNGIVGYGCKMFYSCIAVKFVLGSHSNLKYGARLIDSFLGDNSTISCCEVLNNLIFPAHEQHHNNSFLIASNIKGQSNIAAGATLGSNHNSRANDGEIEAGRGFWPGLCVSVKHSSKFASYTILAKGDYPSELINPFPFGLLNNNVSDNELQVMPAFAWLYNMYSLSRNAIKFQKRDKRIFKIQNIEYDCLAPDSVEEILSALALLEKWTAKAFLASEDKPTDGMDEGELLSLGKKLLNGKKEVLHGLRVTGEGMEKSHRKVVVLKPYEAYHAYMDMLQYYLVKNLLVYLEENPDETFDTMQEKIKGPHVSNWVNLGGQIMKESDFDMLRSDIKEERINSWKEIHKRYNEIWKHYQTDKLSHAYTSLLQVLELQEFGQEEWGTLLNKGIEVQNFINNQVYSSRKKDYENPFRHATCLNDKEFEKAYGRLDENDFIHFTQQESAGFVSRIQSIKNRLETI